MTIETLLLLRDLLAAQQLAVGADGFAESVQAVLKALRELDEAIAAQEATLVG